MVLYMRLKGRTPPSRRGSDARSPPRGGRRHRRVASQRPAARTARGRPRHDLALIRVGAGWDNPLLRLGRDLLVHLRAASCRRRWLITSTAGSGLLAPRLPVPIPVPLRETAPAAARELARRRSTRSSDALRARFDLKRLRSRRWHAAVAAPPCQAPRHCDLTARDARTSSLRPASRPTRPRRARARAWALALALSTRTDRLTAIRSSRLAGRLSPPRWPPRSRPRPRRPAIATIRERDRKGHVACTDARSASSWSSDSCCR